MRATASPILFIGALVLLVLLAYKATPLILIIVFPVLIIQLTVGRW